MSHEARRGTEIGVDAEVRLAKVETVLTRVESDVDEQGKSLTIHGRDLAVLRDNITGARTDVTALRTELQSRDKRTIAALTTAALSLLGLVITLVVVVVNR